MMSVENFSNWECRHLETDCWICCTGKYGQESEKITENDTGKTITISNEAYLEIKRLNEENSRLRSLVEATETDLFDQKKKRRRLEKENDNLSMSIKGMASGKANLDKSYQELEKLYGRLEGENAELVKRWADLELYCRTNIAWYKDQDSYDKRCPGTYRDSCEALDDVLAEMEELQAGSK